MKKHLPFVALLSIIICAVSCKSDTEKANEVLNYAMKMEEARAAYNPDVASDTALLPSQESIYTDSIKKVPTRGELIKKYKVKSVKTISSSGTTITNYDRKGNEMGSGESEYSGKSSFEYDKDGHMTKHRIKYKDGTVSTFVYAYNEEGKEISRTYTGSDGKSSVTRFEYDKALQRRTEISDNGIDKEFYDNRGLRVQFESYDDKGKLVGMGTAQYDKDGLKISEKGTIFGMDNHDAYEYNEAGQLVKMHRTGIANVDFIYEYDEKGLMTKETTIGGLASGETKYEYTYYK